MAYEQTREDYTVSDDPRRLDAVAVHAYLTRSYWAAGIPLEVVERAIANSLCVGLYHNGQQVGFARVVTDRATFAYLCDVYVLEEHRGRGLSKWMMEAVLAHGELRGLRRFLLGTLDAHELYRRFGFTELAEPGRMMEIMNRDVYARPCISQADAEP